MAKECKAAGVFLGDIAFSPDLGVPFAASDWTKWKTGNDFPKMTTCSMVTVDSYKEEMTEG